MAACGREEPAAADTGKPDKSTGPLKLDFEKLASYNYKPGTAVPDEIMALEGKKIQLTGYMYPTNKIRDLSKFIFMKDRGTCCYGSKAQWTHFLQVTIPKGKETINYSTDPVTVVGTFRVNEQVEDGYVLGLYDLAVESHGR